MRRPLMMFLSVVNGPSSLALEGGRILSYNMGMNGPQWRRGALNDHNALHKANLAHLTKMQLCGINGVEWEQGGLNEIQRD